jgi:hypothetical protein
MFDAAGEIAAATRNPLWIIWCSETTDQAAGVGSAGVRRGPGGRKSAQNFLDRPLCAQRQSGSDSAITTDRIADAAATVAAGRSHSPGALQLEESI